MEMASGPESRMMPTPPPAAVAIAAMVSSGGVVRIGLVMVDSPRLGNGGAAERWLAQAKVAIAEERWLLAEDRLRRVREARPRDLELARLLAQVLRENQKVREAERLLLDAWRLGSDAAWEGRRDLLLELADLRLAEARPAEAAAALKRVLEVEANHWEALALLGDAFLDSGHPREAARSYRESISANPFEASSWWNLASALERVGELEAAAEALDGWLRVAGDSSERARVEADISRLRSGSRSPGEP